MGFSDIFDPIVDGLEQRRKTLIQEQIQTETNNISNQWLEKVNVHAMEMEQQGNIGAGYSDEQAQWFKEEESKLLAQIRDPRIKEKFKQSSSNIRSNFAVSSKKQEIEYLLAKESQGVEADVNFQMGLMSSAKDTATLDMDFKNVILPNINSKIDNATNEALREGFKQKYAITTTNYVDNDLSLLEQEIYNGTIKEEDYRERLNNLQEFITKDPDFYRNIPNDTFSRILNKVRGAVENSAEKFSVIRSAKIIQDLPAMKQSRQVNGEPFTPDETEVIVNSYSPEKREAARIDIESFNETIPYYQAKNLANIPAMLAAKQEIDKEVRRLLELKNPGIRLTVLQQAQATLTKDLSDTSKLAQDNYYEFVRNHPDVRAAERLSEIDARGDALVIDAVIKVAKQNNEELTFVEFLDEGKASGLANGLLAEGTTPSEASVLIQGILQKYDKPYEGGNVADNVLRQVASKLSSGTQAAMDYYDTPTTFAVLWGSMVSMKDKSKAEVYEGLGITETDLTNKVDNKFKDFFATLDQGQTNSRRELAKGAVAYILSSPSSILNKKLETVDDLNKAVNFVHDAMVKDAYSLVDDNREKVVRIPKKVKGTNYDLAANIVADPGFKQSALDWFQTQDPTIKLSGDFTDQLVLTDEQRKFVNKINKEKLIESIGIKTSRDGVGVQLVMRIANGEEQPVVFRNTGEAVIPFDVIQSHRAFIGPYQAGTTEELFNLNIFQRATTSKDSKARKEAKEAIKRGNEVEDLVNEDTFFDDVDVKSLEDEALGLTRESKSIQSNLEALQREMESNTQSIEDLLQ